MNTATIIADDFTGAADAGVQFHNCGFRVTVALHHTSSMGPGGGVTSISTETRNLTQPHAEHVLNGLAIQLSAALQHSDTVSLLYKKIDSTLRGWIGAEVRCLLDQLPDHVAWIAPSYPAQGRGMENGVYSVHGTSLHQTVYAAEVHGPLPNSRVQELLQYQVGEPVAHVTAATVRGGHRVILGVLPYCARFVLFDAVNDTDLAHIAQAGLNWGKPILWVGSPGLAQALAAELAPCASPVAQRPRVGTTIGMQTVLAVVGSRNAVARRQVEVWCEGAVVNRYELSVRGRQLRQCRESAVASPICLLTFDTFEDAAGTGASLELAAALGAAAATLARQHDCKRLVLTGGDTAAATCRSLGVKHLEIVGQVEAGIPLMRVHGGDADGGLIVTKAGGFGSPEVLKNAVNRLQDTHEA